MTGIAEKVLDNIILICFGKVETFVTSRTWSWDLLWLSLSFPDTFFVHGRSEVIRSDHF